MTAIKDRTVIFLALSFIFFLNVFSVRHLTLTYDESDHFTYGYRILSLDSNRFDDSKMPISAVNAVPWRAAKLFHIEKHPGKLSARFFDIRTGRYITILFSLVLAIYVFRWSSELYGKRAGFFSLFLYTFSPNIIAHSQLVTVDFYVTAAITIAVYYFYKFVSNKNYSSAAKSALALGVSQLTKYTAVYLYPIFILIIMIRFLANIRSAKNQTLIKSISSFLKYSAYFLLINILVINAGYLFNGIGTPLRGYSFKSSLFQLASHALSPVKDVPIPLPYPFLQGLDGVKYLDDTGGNTFGNTYLLGKLHLKGAKFQEFKGYFFWAFLFKEPITIQIFLWCTLISLFRNRKKRLFLDEELFIFVPVLFFSVYFNYFFKTQIGIRFFLVVLPLLYIFCGGLMSGWEAWSRRAKNAMMVLCLYLVISVMSYFPHYLAYFNELVWDRKMAYKILGDSNIDWKQSEWYLGEYLKKHPSAHVNPEHPVTGTVVVGVNKLLGITEYPEKYRWLREGLEPVDHVARAYLVYDIPSWDNVTPSAENK